MLKMKIGDTKLNDKDINVFVKKSRAFLINKEGFVLVAKYGGVYLLPGGGFEPGETSIKAVIRELKEETGLNYNKKDLDYLISIEHYKKNYLQKNGTVVNRMVTCSYYIGELKEEIDVNSQELSESEKNSQFSLELIPYENLKKVILNNKTDNHRNDYFVTEFLALLKVYEEYRKGRQI